MLERLIPMSIPLPICVAGECRDTENISVARLYVKDV